MEKGVKASVVSSYILYGFKSPVPHKLYTLQIRYVTYDNGKEVKTTNWNSLAESDNAKELYEKAVQIDPFARCPFYYNHHIGSICQTCGMKN